ncbi:MAG TPA: tripartite tricarboxylate transporter substrate binding protein [Burkholderiales bacterium]|jgi:tripartite-type tricarboxylate transporter receptor subunit TctC|nr:tripartite tricarboxylate transporter substrate binding protein [Burkholderiales bacterium]
MKSVLLLVILTVWNAAFAFPTKPVKIIVAFPPGGGTDIVARLLASRLGEAWGQAVIVENRAGASGTVGTEAAARAEADGHTLFMATMGNMTANQHLYPKMTVDPLRAFAPITKVVDVHFVFLANPALPAKGVQELIELAKKRPGEIAYSSSGPGGAPHLAMELFKRRAGVDLQHVPYKGSGPSFNDLIGGRVMLTMDSLVQSLPHIRAGRLKALAVLGPRRTALLPEVPTIAESGLPGYALANWFGLLAPAATPKQVLVQLSGDVLKILKQEDLQKKIADLGADVVGNSAEEFGAAMRAESAQWAEVIKAAGIRVEE